MNEDLKKNLAFSIKFFALFSLGYLLVLNFPLDGLTGWIASVQGTAFGIAPSGNQLLVQGTPFVVNNSCTGLVSAVILGSIVFSLRRPELWKKAGIFLAGFLILFPLNLVRVYFVIWFGFNVSVEWAETVHVISWFVMSAAILASWHYFTKKITKTERFYELL